MRVLIADDHTLFRKGLRSLLRHEGMEIVGEARSGLEALELTRAHRPDVVLMDLSMPELDGLKATRAISAEMPEVKVVVLTASEEDSDLFEALKSGAQGYLSKDLEADQFFSLLERVVQGELALPPDLAKKVLEEFARPVTSLPEQAAILTEREIEVLELLVQGITSTRALAGRLVVTESTVRYHLGNILSKLHLQNRAQIVAYALNEGLVNRPGPS